MVGILDHHIIESVEHQSAMNRFHIVFRRVPGAGKMLFDASCCLSHAECWVGVILVQQLYL
jgi:hypothetical protein